MTFFIVMVVVFVLLLREVKRTMGQGYQIRM